MLEYVLPKETCEKCGDLEWSKPWKNVSGDWVVTIHHCKIEMRKVPPPPTVNKS